MSRNEKDECSSVRSRSSGDDVADMFVLYAVGMAAVASGVVGPVELGAPQLKSFMSEENRGTRWRYGKRTLLIHARNSLYDELFTCLFLFA